MENQQNNHTHVSDPAPKRESMSDEIRREDQLVRSTGMISKQVMGIAFGAAFLLIAAFVATASEQLVAAFCVGSIGVLAIVWSLASWARQHRSRHRQSQ